MRRLALLTCLTALLCALAAPPARAEEIEVRSAALRPTEAGLVLDAEDGEAHIRHLAVLV